MALLGPLVQPAVALPRHNGCYGPEAGGVGDQPEVVGRRGALAPRPLGSKRAVGQAGAGFEPTAALRMSKQAEKFAF